MIFLDTHCLIWMFEGDFRRFSKPALSRMGEETLHFSPFAQLELAFLHEKGIISHSPDWIIQAVNHDFGIEEFDQSLGQVCHVAEKESWTRDPFDRLIVAAAKLEEAQLVSKDRVIRKHYSGSLW